MPCGKVASCMPHIHMAAQGLHLRASLSACPCVRVLVFRMQYMAAIVAMLHATYACYCTPCYFIFIFSFPFNDKACYFNPSNKNKNQQLHNFYVRVCVCVRVLCTMHFRGAAIITSVCWSLVSCAWKRLQNMCMYV